MEKRQPLLKRTLIIGIAQLALVIAPVLAGGRAVTGTVYYGRSEPANNAAVQLEDQVTLQVISRRTDRDGHYRFTGLNPDRDYEIRAAKRGYWSKPRAVSRFSSRAVEKIDLYLKPGRGKK
ncbi:MAG: carboxypeptidase-like regulatory domain-containing protein [Bryobacteraceae bacterium]